jgi:hypothetical protein
MAGRTLERLARDCEGHSAVHSIGFGTDPFGTEVLTITCTQCPVALRQAINRGDVDIYAIEGNGRTQAIIKVTE